MAKTRSVASRARKPAKKRNPGSANEKSKRSKKKSSVKKKSVKPAGPTSLELCLHAPGMNTLLRAGLGGLASVLLKLEEKPERVKLPGAPWPQGIPPWKITSDRITLQFGEPGNAGEYLKRLFEFAFQIKREESAIDLPSTYPDVQDRVVRARLQRGIMLTFLQHGQSRKGAKKDENKTAKIDGKQVSYSIRPLTSFKHQAGYSDLVHSRNQTILTKNLELPGTLFPGAAVRHNRFNSSTKHEGTVAEILAAYFALIGTIALPVNRGSAVLLVPEVTDLISFGENREAITPRDAGDCLVGGIGDAVLGVYLRLRERKLKRDLEVPAISAYLFRPTVWASQQKSRVAVNRIEPLNPFALKVFEYASQFFKAQLKSQTTNDSGTGGKKKARENEHAFWSLSIVKPLIADNLANGKPWFEDFATLFTRKDPATGKPLRTRLFFEKEGLAKMVKSDVWDREGQEALVVGVQFALSCQFGKISGEFGTNKGGMRNKFQKEFEKWRIQFVSSKTADQFRFAVCDLMSRARGNREIQEKWQTVLPLLSDDHWQHGRDLALLALASYRGRGDKEISAVEATNENEEAAW